MSNENKEKFVSGSSDGSRWKFWSFWGASRNFHSETVTNQKLQDRI